MVCVWDGGGETAACPGGAPLPPPGSPGPACPCPVAAVAHLGSGPGGGGGLGVSPGLAPPLAPPGLSPRVTGAGAACLLPRGALDSCLAKMAPALLLRRRRRLRALGRRRRPLSLTERRGAGTRGAMAGGRRGAMARPEQSSPAYLRAAPVPRLRPAAPLASPPPLHGPPRPHGGRRPRRQPAGGPLSSMRSRGRLVGSGGDGNCRRDSGEAAG